MLLAQSEAGQNEDWDDSSLTKEQAEERLRKKVEAVMKRERAMAYAYSHRVNDIDFVLVFTNVFIKMFWSNCFFSFLHSFISLLQIQNIFWKGLI